MTIDKAKQYTPKHSPSSCTPLSMPLAIPMRTVSDVCVCVCRANNEIDLQKFVKLELAPKIDQKTGRISGRQSDRDICGEREGERERERER